MELRVWVDGVQRVVCGITDQTTVQEVVIALAQATGRTGRYTLVERWRNAERLLPPSETPLTVLAKWGTYASDVQFILRRSGATDSSKGPTTAAQQLQQQQQQQRNDVISSNFDKNQQIRQSLPTQDRQSKSRQYSAADIRHEKSRKSLGPSRRGESSSSLPVTAQAQSALRSGSPQRRHMSPSRPHPRATSKTRQPSPSRLRMQRAEYQRVLMEQQQLIKEHEDHLRRLTEKLTDISQREFMMKDEERKLAEQIRTNDTRITEENDKRNSKIALDREIKSKKEEMKHITEKQSDHDRKLLETQRSIDEHHRRQKAQADRIRMEEERLIHVDMSRFEQDVRDKEVKIDELNRELRKVNLQSFVRETSGSKVTVLPPAHEPAHRKEPSTSSQSSVGQKIGVSQNESSSGVWV